MEKEALIQSPLLTGNNASKVKERNTSLDALRVLAAIMVIATHFFLSTDFYGRNLVGPRLFVMTVIRSFGMASVPIFIMLTGYFMKNKKVNVSHFSGIKKVLVTYGLASLCCYVFLVIHYNKPWSVSDFIFRTLNFSAAEYSWYIEMYIGLFLLIPFLNLIWNNLEKKSHRVLLIAVLLFLTAVPLTFNIFTFGVEGWWKNPVISDSYRNIFPNAWQKFFPLPYYFIGCYLRDYRPKMNKVLNAVLIVIATVAYGGFCFYRSTPKPFVWGTWQDHGAFPVMIVGVLVFIFMINTDLSRLPDKLRNLIRRLGELSLASFLVSSIFDIYYYEFLNERVNDIAQRFNYYPIIVPLCLISSFVLAFIVNEVSKQLVKLIDILYAVVKKAVLKPADKKEAT